MADQRRGVYLENYRAKGQSFDSFAGEPGTFDYSRNIDIFANLKGITLASKEENNDDPEDSIKCYCTYGEDQLYKVCRDGPDEIKLWVSDGTDFATFGTLEFTIDQSTLGIFSTDYGVPYNAVVFEKKIFVLCDKQIFEYDPATTTVTKVTPSGRYDEDCDIIPSFNYHETLLIVAKNTKVWTYDPLLGSALGRSTVRDFSQGTIVGLLQYDELIGICVNHNGVDSRIYVVGGNFDVDDIGILDRTTLKGISVVNIAQMGSRIFFTAQNHGDSGRGQFYELIGKTPVSIKESRVGASVTGKENPGNVNNYEFDFVVKAVNSLATGLLPQSYPNAGNILYIPTIDGIWAYGSPNRKVEEAMTYLHDYVANANPPLVSTIYKDYLYVYFSGDECRYYIGKNSNGRTYAPSGYLKGRSYGGDMMTLEKETLNLAIAYDLPHDSCSIEIWMRQNGGGVVGQDRDKVHTITDTTKKFIVIDPTDVPEISEILADWNYIDYALKLITTNDNYAPMVYEHGMFYDYVRNVL